MVRHRSRDERVPPSPQTRRQIRRNLLLATQFPSHPTFSSAWQRLLNTSFPQQKAYNPTIKLARANLSKRYCTVQELSPPGKREPDVQRLLINLNGDASVIAGGEMEIAPSRVGEDDVETSIEEDADWYYEKTVKEWKECYYAMLPWEKRKDDREVWERMVWEG